MISNEQYHDNLAFVSVTDTGYNHRKNSMKNQDAVQFLYDEGDYVLAVADGVGTCRFADIGAASAVSAALKAFDAVQKSLLVFEPEDIISFILNEWNSQHSGNANDYCTTLKAAIKKSDYLMFISVGDGMLVFTSGEQSYMIQNDENDFINQTKCLSEHTGISDFRNCMIKLEPDSSYVVFSATDGVSNFIRSGFETDFVREIENNIEKSKLKYEITKFIKDISEFSSDDRTAGVIKYEKENAGS